MHELDNLEQIFQKFNITINLNASSDFGQIQYQRSFDQSILKHLPTFILNEKCFSGMKSFSVFRLESPRFLTDVFLQPCTY